MNPPTPASHRNAVAAQLDRLLDLFRVLTTAEDLKSARATVAHLRDVAAAIEGAVERRVQELRSEGVV